MRYTTGDGGRDRGAGMGGTATWDNRIVKRADVPPEQLLANPKNCRRHTREQKNALRATIRKVGYIDPVLCTLDDTVIDGHLRVEVALEDGIATIPVDYYDGTDEQADLILATKDPLAAMAYHDAEAVAALHADLGEQEAAIDALLRRVAEEAGVAETITEGLTDPDAVPAVQEEPVTKPGDLWLLGRHRLLCGDATVVTDVAALLDGVIPPLTVTDPPYGVEYDPEWRTSLDDWSHATGLVTNDDRIDWREAFALVASDVIYCWHAGRHASAVQASIESAGYITRSQIIWAKPHYPLSRGHYHWQHEPCWYAVRKGATAHWVGDRKQTTLWQIDNATFQGSLGAEDKSTGHGTQKPVECMARPIRNHEGDVYDPFLGSGTTMIAAEQLGRTCYGMEIDPHYCDVIVRRWEQFTGQTATLATAAPRETAAG